MGAEGEGSWCDRGRNSLSSFSFPTSWRPGSPPAWKVEEDTGTVGFVFGEAAKMELLPDLSDVEPWTN
jgi:hypothetical protein